MDTHYHLLLHEREQPLSLGMWKLNSDYARYFNKRHARRGHVFDGRYTDRVIADNTHLLAAIRYIARNPVGIDGCASPRDWRWSSYPQLAGVGRRWSFIADAHCLSLFSPRRDAAIALVHDFVEKGPGPGTGPGPFLGRPRSRLR